MPSPPAASRRPVQRCTTLETISVRRTVSRGDGQRGGCGSGSLATLRDVAARADVSIATVARVLRQDPTLVVRPETRERVLAAATGLAYRPDRLARALRTGRTGTLALFLPDPQNLMWNPVVRGVERVAAERGYLAVVADAHGPAL